MALKPDAAARKDALGAKHPATLQHRHFAVIAGILADLDGDTHGVSRGQHRDICEHFAIRLAATNPNFDRKRFMTACDAVED